MDDQIRLPGEAFILAGGGSRRFGSDKARYELRGQPMIQCIADTLAANCERVTVVAKEAGAYADLGLNTVADHYSQQSPLSGVLTALELAGSAWAFICACDLPQLTGELCRRLWQQRTGWGVVPSTAGLLHPLAAWYHRDSLPHLLAAYREGHFSLRRALEHQKFTIIEWDQPEILLNLNRLPEGE